MQQCASHVRIYPRGMIFIATSLDGFIAKPDGSVDWLNELQATLPPGEDGGFRSFMKTVDYVVMGRKTFDTVLGFLNDGIEWPYGKTPVLVLTNTMSNVQIPEHLSTTVTVGGGGSTLQQIMEWINQAIPGTHDKLVYIDGAATIRCFFSEGLIEKAIITTFPIRLGDGISLFTEDEWKMLSKVSRKTFANGFVQTAYEFVNNIAPRQHGCP